MASIHQFFNLNYSFDLFDYKASIHQFFILHFSFDFFNLMASINQFFFVYFSFDCAGKERSQSDAALAESDFAASLVDSNDKRRQIRPRSRQF